MDKFEKILKTISDSIDKFDNQIPAIQKKMMQELETQLSRLDTDDTGSLKQTVKNIQILSSIKNKLNKIILNPDYIKNVSEFVSTFNTIATIQNEYWESIEKTFKPKPLLREIRIQAIDNTIDNLTESGIGNNITPRIYDVLKANITTGGSLFKMERILRGQVVGTKEFSGYLDSYTKQITTDAINQYNAQYTHAVASGLKYEWYAYQGSDITTTRQFCFALTDLRYFHVSEIPRLLAAKGLNGEGDLIFIDEFTNETGPVKIYAKTNLPYGMIPGTNAQNFFINRGGYNCGHQIRPVSIDVVPQKRQDEVYATSAYIAWKKING